VGFCAYDSDSAQDIDSNDWINGWVMVTN